MPAPVVSYLNYPIYSVTPPFSAFSSPQSPLNCFFYFQFREIALGTCAFRLLGRLSACCAQAASDGTFIVTSGGGGGKDYGIEDKLVCMYTW